MYTQDTYPEAFKKLQPEIRKKAIEILNALIEEEEMEAGKAIPISISKAKEWYENQQQS